MKIYLFFAVLALFIALWLLLFKPFEIETERLSKRGLSFENFIYKTLTPKGTKTIIKGKKGIKTAQELRVEDLVLIDEKHNILQAKKGLYGDGKVILEKDISFQTRDFNLTTQKAIYYIKLAFLRIPTPFFMISSYGTVNGKKMVYNQKSGKIVAYDIQAHIKSVP